MGELYKTAQIKNESSSVGLPEKEEITVARDDQGTLHRVGHSCNCALKDVHIQMGKRNKESIQGRRNQNGQRPRGGLNTGAL